MQNKDKKYLVECSFFEIYNEQIFDLLAGKKYVWYMCMCMCCVYMCVYVCICPELRGVGTLHGQRSSRPANNPSPEQKRCELDHTAVEKGGRVCGGFD